MSDDDSNKILTDDSEPPPLTFVFSEIELKTAFAWPFGDETIR